MSQSPSDPPTGAPSAAEPAWQTRRDAGVLLDTRSLPDGGHTADAQQFIDWLADAGFGVWQVLPQVIPDATGSPYQSVSAFAADPTRTPRTWADRRPTNDERNAWLERESDWADDYALFQALRQQNGGAAWTHWPAPLRDRDPAALADVHREHAAAIEQHIDAQWAADQAWAELREHARARGVALLGDAPIFVAHDSADVWAHREQFRLNAAGQPRVVAGVPPDYFSATGQRWGNPHYDWDAMSADGFAWWRARLARAARWFDRLRIDHFRGLESVWVIDADAENAIEGHWETVPGRALLDAVSQALPTLEILAEDLGIITPEVDALRRDYALAGMAVLQFSFDHFDDNPHKPHNIGAERVVYTGTHDNDTSAGWYTALDSEMRARVDARLALPRCDGAIEPQSGAHAAWALWREALATRASTAIVPLQDLLGLGSVARTNTPGTTAGNWCWRLDWTHLDRPDRAGFAAQLRIELAAAGRIAAPEPPVSASGAADTA